MNVNGVSCAARILPFMFGRLEHQITRSTPPPILPLAAYKRENRSAMMRMPDYGVTIGVSAEGDWDHEADGVHQCRVGGRGGPHGKGFGFWRHARSAGGKIAARTVRAGRRAIGDEMDVPAAAVLHAEVMTRSYAGMSQGASAVLTDDVKRLPGRDATSFDQGAKDYAHFFRLDGPRATLAAYP
jgi:hypothetical protein